MSFSNLQPDDVLTVYHGTSLSHVPALINGIDADRVVYRYYGGPRHAGLFVSPDLDLAERFAHYGEIILELHVEAQSLQGTDYSGRQEPDDRWAWKYPNSFSPGLSSSLDLTAEPQALLTGQVPPSRIIRVGYKPFGQDRVWHSRRGFTGLGLETKTPGGREKRIQDASGDLTSPNYTLGEFMELLANVIDVDRERVVETLNRYASMGERGLSRVSDILWDADFGDAAIASFVKKLLDATPTEPA